MVDLLIMLLLAALFAFLGYQFRFRGKVHWLAGYREGAVADPVKLGQRVGNNFSYWQ